MREDLSAPVDAWRSPSCHSWGCTEREPGPWRCPSCSERDYPVFSCRVPTHRHRTWMFEWGDVFVDWTKNLNLCGISLMSLTTGVASHDVWARPYRYFQLFSWRDMERTETAGLLSRFIPASLTYSGSSVSRLSGEKSRLLVGPSLASCFLRSLACFMAWIFRLLMWSLPYKGTLVWKSEMGSTASSRDSPSDRDNGRQDHSH